MVIKTAYLKPIHPYSYRHKDGHNGRIHGVFLADMDNGIVERPCFMVVYPCGFTDYVPLSEVEKGNYEVIANPEE
jgi:hypothetical protein